MSISKYQKIFGVGPAGFLISAVLVGLLWLLNRALGPVQLPALPPWTRTAGMILIVCWICWHAWAISTIRSWWTRDRLCTTGPFRLVRHPIYAGGILLASPGVALIAKSWFLLLWPIILYSVWSLLVRKEENMMKAVFGQQYEQYAARTGRFVPRLSVLT